MADDRMMRFGPPPRPELDRERIYDAVQQRLHKDRQLRPVRRILAVGAVAIVVAISLSRTGPEVGETPRAPAIAERASGPSAPAESDWLAVAQAPGTRMMTRTTMRGIEITLEAGGLAAEVQPGSRSELVVRTDTADVRVTGTTIAVLVDEDGATRVAVGEGRAVVSARRGGGRHTVESGEAVSLAERLTVLDDPGSLTSLLSSLPFRWHERPPSASAPVESAEPATTPRPNAEASLAGRGCDAVDEARSLAEATTTPRPARRAALELLARCAALGGDPMERARWLEALVEVAPDHPVAWLELGRLRERRLGDPTGAALAYRRHLGVAGSGPLGDEAALALCRVSWDHERCLRRFLADRPDSDRRREAEEALEALQQR